MRHAAARVAPLLRRFGGIVAIVTLQATPAPAQTAAPGPGPWVLDVRAVTSPVPTDAAFYPPLASAFVPSRGFGLDLGGHVYLFSFKAARVGIGANVLVVRSRTTAPANATAGDASTTEARQRLTMNLNTVAPQLSVNFGSREGWSYLSAGIGVASVNTETGDVLPDRRESGRLRSVNFGGGARWFIKTRLAFGFDLRAHQIAAGTGTPKTSVFAVGAGLSFR